MNRVARKEEMDQQRLETLDQICPGRVRRDESLRGWTTFRCGATAWALVSPRGIAELAELLKWLSAEDAQFQVIGRGSNLLVKDGGYPGVLIDLTDGFSSIEILKETDATVTLRAEAGVANGALLQYLRDRDLGGFEFSFGIPGSIGGGIRMNAGTPQGWFSDVVRHVEGVKTDGTPTTFAVKSTDFRYRDFPKGKGIVITAGRFVFPHSTPEKIESSIASARQKRANQPLELPNVGSIFKNPEGDFAGRLIEAAGLKGLGVGDAQISPKHANFIVNLGHATTADVLTLIDRAQRDVKRKFAVDLEQEVHVIGVDA